MSVLNKIVSCFSSANATEPPKDVNLLTWLHSMKYRSFVEFIRTLDKSARNIHKKSLPCVTVSGTFGSKEGSSLQSFTGLIAIDIDNNTKAESMNKLMSLPYVAYIGESVSGTGFFCIIPISNDVSNFLYHFEAIREEFAGYGIEIDKSCKDISRMRFYSFDDNAYFNHEATTYLNVKYPEVKQRNETLVGPDSTYTRVLEQIGILKQKGIDITHDYGHWIKIGAGFYNYFGEDGRGLFHELSCINPNYKEAEANKQYDNCAKMRRCSINTFFYLAKQYIV